MADRITGSILDAGCGNGENALFFAGRGCKEQAQGKHQGWKLFSPMPSLGISAATGS